MRNTDKDIKYMKDSWAQWNPAQRKGFLIFIGVLCFLFWRGCIYEKEKPKTAGQSIANTYDKPELQEAWIISKQFVKTILKAPASAEFPYDNAGGSIEQNRYNINAYVDAQNSFGALLRSNYYCKMDYKGGNWADINNWDLIYLSLDGKDYYNKNNIK